MPSFELPGAFAPAEDVAGEDGERLAAGPLGRAGHQHLGHHVWRVPAHLGAVELLLGGVNYPDRPASTILAGEGGERLGV